MRHIHLTASPINSYCIVSNAVEPFETYVCMVEHPELFEVLDTVIPEDAGFMFYETDAEKLAAAYAIEINLNSLSVLPSPPPSPQIGDIWKVETEVNGGGLLGIGVLTNAGETKEVLQVKTAVGIKQVILS